MVSYSLLGKSGFCLQPWPCHVALRVCPCVRIVRTGKILAKIKNVTNDVYRFWHLQSACNIASVVLCDLDLLFSRSSISNVIILKTVRASAKPQEMTCRFQYLPSNGIIANVILFDLDLLFKVKLQMAISRKRWKLAQNCKRSHDIRFPAQCPHNTSAHCPAYVSCCYIVCL